MLKAELHVHTQEDPEDSKLIRYTARGFIDEAARQGFEVLAFTCHNKVIHTKELEEYAGKKGILLIPGVERTIKGKHVLLYNLTEEESRQVTSFEELEKLKKSKQEQNQPFLVVAAHPFHLGPTCLRERVIKYLDLFDAWESSFFYTSYFDKNKKIWGLAERYKKPIIGSSDLHHLEFLGRTYTLVETEKKIESIFQAIRQNQMEIKTKPLGSGDFLKLFWWAAFNSLRKIIQNKAKSL